jgi:hypothetical protein
VSPAEAARECSGRKERAMPWLWSTFITGGEQRLQARLQLLVAVRAAHGGSKGLQRRVIRRTEQFLECLCIQERPLSKRVFAPPHIAEGCCLSLPVLLVLPGCCCRCSRCSHSAVQPLFIQQPSAPLLLFATASPCLRLSGTSRRHRRRRRRQFRRGTRRHHVCHRPAHLL